MTEADHIKVMRVVTEGFRGLVVAPGQSLACVLSLAVAGCLIVLSASAGSLTMSMLDRASSSARMLVYLRDEVDSGRVNQVVAEISRRPDVESVEYMSREEDRQENADLLPADIVNKLPGDAIPGQHGLRVKFRDLGVDGDLAGLAAFLRTLEGVDIVAEPPVGSAAIRALASAVGFVRVTINLLAVVLLAGTLFFVVATLTRTMDSRREEMQILRLVGATNAFLKAPLYIQALLQSVAGLSLGGMTALLIIKSTNAYLVTELGVGTGLPTHVGLVFLVAIPGGVMVGLAGAVIATSRRLH